MAYFSDVRQLLRNGGLTSYLKIRMKMAEHTHTHTHTHTPTHTHTQAFIPVSMTLHRYRFILLGGERHCGSKLFHLRTYHIDPARS